jgi:hypothetical protein
VPEVEHAVGDGVDRQGLPLAGVAPGELGGAVGEVASADRDPVGDADQLDVAELHPWTLVAVVDDHLGAGQRELVPDRVDGLQDVRVIRVEDDDGDGEGCDLERPDDPGGVVMALDDGGHGPLDSDPVAAHDGRDLAAVGPEDRQAERLGVPVAELEDVADLDRAQGLEPLAAVGARLPGGHLAQVRPPPDLDVATDVDAPEVQVVGVGAGEHAATAPDRQVGDDRQVAHADRAEAAGGGAERRTDLGWAGGAHLPRAGGVEELLLDQAVVPAQQDQGSLPIDQIDERLDLPVRRSVVVPGQILDGAGARGRERLRGRQPRAVMDGGQGRGRLLDVGGVPAGLAADHQVLAGV